MSFIWEQFARVHPTWFSWTQPLPGFSRDLSGSGGSLNWGRMNRSWAWSGFSVFPLSRTSQMVDLTRALIICLAFSDDTVELEDVCQEKKRFESCGNTSWSYETPEWMCQPTTTTTTTTTTTSRCLEGSQETTWLARELGKKLRES